MYKAKNSISIKLASPEKILEGSFGEVLKPETINYRSYKPEKDGLFCEKIFGPVKDFECHCGKYKGIRYRGIICDRCGVEVTTKKVRRNRMGHITLAVPVVHIWFLKSIPSKLSYILGKSAKQLESVIYYENYLVINPGKSGYKRFELIDEEAFLELDQEFGYDAASQEEREEESYFQASMGGEAIKEALAEGGRGGGDGAGGVIEGAVSAETYESTRSTLGPHDCVCYCTIGYRSGQYAEKMAKAAAGGTDDARYFNLYGSILAWTHAGGACVVPATGERTTRVHTFGKQWSCVADGYEAVYFKRPLAKGFGQMVRGWFGRKK